MPGRRPVFARLTRLLWAASLVLPAVGASAGVVLTTLHTFRQPFPNGANPAAGLVQGGDGYFYGTTENGGTNGYGTVFKVSTNGALNSLHSFTGGNDGANPVAVLAQGSDGSFYGTTYYGGTSNVGTVFKVSTNGALTSLYSFTGGKDGADPSGGLVEGSDGSLLGTTEYGGADGAGTVFRISTNGEYTSLYSFTGGIDGGNPEGGLAQGGDGSFYGTTYYGGTSFYPGYGTVFRFSTNGALTSLCSFSGGEDGAGPNGLVQGSDGSFYGTTYYGGTTVYPGYGTVFQISTNGALSSLHSFTGGSDGANPVAALAQGSDGNLYGTTGGGGAHGDGTVFKISTDGELGTLYSFTGTNVDASALAQGSDGYFYGTTYYGGTSNAGTVFQISTNGALTSLHSFTSDKDGGAPGTLVQGSDGYFYGTTEYGGASGDGTVFKISASGVYTSLYSFTGGEVSAGAVSPAALVQASDGYLYGTTFLGGNFGDGTVFRISTNGALTRLHSFSDGEAGYGPNGLVQARDGDFYGATYYGGTGGGGGVFRISTNGVVTPLYSFPGANIGASVLMQASDGYLYGTTVSSCCSNNGASTLYKISTNGAYTGLYAFLNYFDGEGPDSGVVQVSDGTFYGTTSGGGTNGVGTVFRFTTNLELLTMFSFNGTNGESVPAGLVQGSDGYFYGTTFQGGQAYEIGVGEGAGTVFRIGTNGPVTSLYSFTGGKDGSMPLAGLVQGSDGSFYGTTYEGGAGGSGTVFRLTIVPEFQAVTVTNGVLSLAWSTEAGGMYQLQYNSDLSSSNWINLSTPVTATGATLSTTDTVTNGPQRFYRLALSP